MVSTGAALHSFSGKTFNLSQADNMQPRSLRAARQMFSLTTRIPAAVNLFGLGAECRCSDRLALPHHSFVVNKGIALLLNVSQMSALASDHDDFRAAF